MTPEGAEAQEQGLRACESTEKSLLETASLKQLSSVPEDREYIGRQLGAYQTDIKQHAPTIKFLAQVPVLICGSPVPW